MIGICTDSNAQLPTELARRFAVEVVPLTVSLDGADRLEGVDLGADEFYERLAAAPRPVVSTAAPAPDRFLRSYRRLVSAGAREILSIHVGSGLSGTLNAAHVAAAELDVEVRLVDTGAASFVVACAVWEAAAALQHGRSCEDAAAVAEAVAARCGNVFVVAGLEQARAGGRLDPGAAPGAGGLPVLELADGRMRSVGDVSSGVEAAEVMAALVLDRPGPLRVGIGHSDRSSAAVADHLEELVAAAGGDRELVRYRIGPSVGSHTGPGTAGAVFYRPAAVPGARD